MSEITTNILNIIAPALGAVLTALVGYFIAYIGVKKKNLQEQTDSEVADKYIGMVFDTVKKCVEAVNQTYVDALKNEGAFTAEAQKEAFELCYLKVVELLSDDCKVYVKETFSDLEAYLITVIESTVRGSK